MRKTLLDLVGEKGRFDATFVEFGTRINFEGEAVKTLLLKDVKFMSGEIVTDHAWINSNISLDKIDLKPNDILRFDAEIKRYFKPYRSGRPAEYDFGFNKIRNPHIILTLQQKFKKILNLELNRKAKIELYKITDTNYYGGNEFYRSARKVLSKISSHCNRVAIPIYDSPEMRVLNPDISENDYILVDYDYKEKEFVKIISRTKKI